jgi:hypothetical protein
MSYLVGTKAQARFIRRALARAEDLPARGECVGPIRYEPPIEVLLDGNGDAIPTPGWTVDAVDDPIESPDTNESAIEIPQWLRRHLGKTITVRGQTITLPTVDELREIDGLPARIRAVIDARRVQP